MAKKEYLGEFPIEFIEPKHDLAMRFVSNYGYIDGAHHKQWVIDQVARVLLGTEVIFTEAKWSDGSSELRFSTGDPSLEYLNWLDGDLDDDEAVGITP